MNLIGVIWIWSGFFGRYFVYKMRLKKNIQLFFFQHKMKATCSGIFKCVCFLSNSTNSPSSEWSALLTIPASHMVTSSLKSIFGNHSVHVVVAKSKSVLDVYMSIFYSSESLGPITSMGPPSKPISLKQIDLKRRKFFFIFFICNVSSTFNFLGNLSGNVDFSI